MHRKKFISLSILSHAALLPLSKNISTEFTKTPFLETEFSDHKVPPYLQVNDCIGIVSPAGYMSVDECMPAIQTIQSWGFQVKLGKYVGAKNGVLGGTDEERLSDLQSMLDDVNVQAILCARGGYGIIRIVDKLNFTKYKKNPKWLIGFSDVTVLHSHIKQNFNIATLHSKMCNSFQLTYSDTTQASSIESIKQAITGNFVEYKTGATENNILGEATGVLVGGNLTVLASLSGSQSAMNTKNCILFLEDTNEYLYNIDRMFFNLLRSGILQNLKGLIIGNFKTKPDDVGEEFPKTLEQIVLEKVSSFGYPVTFDFPVGHQKHNVALKCGYLHHLQVTTTETVLTDLSTKFSQ